MNHRRHDRSFSRSSWIARLLAASLALIPVVVATQQPQAPDVPQAQAPQGQAAQPPPQPARQQQWRENKVVLTAAGSWSGPRLADGQPDVSGHWSNTIGNHNNLTDPQGPLGGDDEPGARRRVRPREERAPSRVSDPADGQVPFQPWARAKQQEFQAHLNNPIKPEYVEPLARCAPGGPTKSLMWHGYEIRQYAGYVLFLFDSGTRVIHLDGKPHLPGNVTLWNADSRGRWEGNTLVVDVTNNNAKARLGRSGEFTSDRVHIQERYIFDNAGERFTYEAVYTDPTVFTRPWTITIPNRRVTHKTPQDDWNNLTFFANFPEGASVAKGASGSGGFGSGEPVIEAYERICIEGNGPHGQVATGSQ